MVNSHRPITELFHYCPTESFHGIVSSGALWLHNSDYANDPNENKIAYNIVVDISNDPKAGLIGDFAKSVLDQKFHLVDDSTAFVFSMSEINDDLNQWRVYADYGYGYAIGLRPEYFIQNGHWLPLNNSITNLYYDKIHLARCLYEYDIQRPVVEELLRIYRNMVDPRGLDNVVALKRHLKFYSSIFKHKSYSAEKEWRIFCFPITQIQAPKVSIPYDLLFRSRRGTIIQYIEQNFAANSTFQTPPFESVVLGPNVKNKAHEIMDFLGFNKTNCRRVFQSTLKLREPQ